MDPATLWYRMTLLFTGLFLLGGATDRLLSGDPPLSLAGFSLFMGIMGFAAFTRRMRWLQWCGFILMLQFVIAVLRLFSPGHVPLKLFALLCCVGLFTATSFFINRYRKQLQGNSGETHS